mmetsp:Transcript_25077/g.59714  ORF Transcript_25077/g.59714 Transcript_25077/m.59714 type:complete len:247 (+) Transcript_25077:146-886(+)
MDARFPGSSSVLKMMAMGLGAGFSSAAPGVGAAGSFPEVSPADRQMSYHGALQGVPGLLEPGGGGSPAESGTVAFAECVSRSAAEAPELAQAALRVLSQDGHDAVVLKLPISRIRRQEFSKIGIPAGGLGLGGAGLIEPRVSAAACRAADLPRTPVHCSVCRRPRPPLGTAFGVKKPRRLGAAAPRLAYHNRRVPRFARERIAGGCGQSSAEAAQVDGHLGLPFGAPQLRGGPGARAKRRRPEPAA